MTSKDEQVPQPALPTRPDVEVVFREVLATGDERPKEQR